MSQTEETAGTDYYGYLFEPDKKPTKILESLLRGIADHIVSWMRFCEIGCDETDVCW